MRKIKLLYFLLILLFSISCAINNKNNKLFQSFYMGNGTTQYYIKEMEFKDNMGSNLLLDITIQMKRENNTDAILNFTYKGKSKLNQFDSVYILQFGDTLILNDVLPLFHERIKNNFASRYTSSVNAKKLILFFEDPKWTFQIDAGKTKYNYSPTTKTSNKIQYINNNLFTIY